VIENWEPFSTSGINVQADQEPADTPAIAGDSNRDDDATTVRCARGGVAF
jgi:hypothetical protein